MPPRRKQVGKGKSPVVDVLDIEGITLEDAASPVLSKSKTTLNEVPKDILRNSLKKADLASFMRSTSAAKVFKEALEPEAHPEYVSKMRMHPLEGTQGKYLSQRILIQQSMNYSPATQRLSYGVSKGFYTYDLATDTSVKYHRGGADNSIKKTAFSTDGIVMVILDDSGVLQLWKYDTPKETYAFVKSHTNRLIGQIYDLKVVVYARQVFILTVHEIGGSYVFQTTLNPEDTPFAMIHNYNNPNMELKRFSVSDEKVVLITNKGYKAFVIEPKPRSPSQEFQLTEVPWPEATQTAPANAYPYNAVFDFTGQNLLTVYSTGVIQSTQPKTNALTLWRWGTDDAPNRIVQVKEFPTDTVITNNNRALWIFAAFSPNGRYIAALSFARSPDTKNLYGSPCIDLWEVASGRHVRTIHLKTKTQTAKQVVQLGFFKKDNKDSIFYIDAGFHVYAFSPELPFTGGRTKRSRGGKSPVKDTLDIEGITLEDAAPSVPTSSSTALRDLPQDALRRILTQSSLSTAASAKTTAKFLNTALPDLKEHPGFVSFINDLSASARGELIYAPASQQLIYKDKVMNQNHLFHTYDLTTGVIHNYRHRETPPSYYIQLYVSKDGSVIVSRHQDAPAHIKVWKWNGTEKVYRVLKEYTAEPGTDILKYLNQASYRISGIMQSETVATVQVQFDTTSFQPLLVQPTVPSQTLFNNFHAIYYFQPRHQLILIKGNTITGFALDAVNRVRVPVPEPNWSFPFTTLNPGDLLMVHSLEVSKQGTQFAVLFSKHVSVEGSRMRSVQNHIALWDWPEGSGAPVKKYEIHALKRPEDAISGRVCAYSPNGTHLVFLSAFEKNYWVHVWDIKTNQDACEPVRLRYKTNDSNIGKTITTVVQLGFFKKDKKDHVAVITANQQVFSFVPDVPLIGGRRSVRK